MHLQSLLVTGFKSFAEAKIEFPQGVTAVVGPNGTGKSNIVDALLWSLGEQSAKALRSERMEDVIFNGTETQKPMGMVEVSTIFSGVSEQALEALSVLGDAIGSPTEIMVTRRLFRDGDSEYFINKIPCRLKDIRGLLWASRAGTKGHTVIEQGNIEQLLSASPLERREFIEETAGIMRYKKQKAEALRKLDSTEHNLLRVRDILAEVQRQLRSLERQAKQARDYQQLRARARDLEIALLQWDYRQLADTQERIADELADSEAMELRHQADEARAMAEVEAAKLTLTMAGESVAHGREQVREVEQAMAHALTTIEVERSRMEQYEAQHDQAMKDRSASKEDAVQSQRDLQEVQTGIATCRAELEAAGAAQREKEEEHADLLDRRAAANDELVDLRKVSMDLAVKHTQVENRLSGLHDRQQGLVKRLERLSTEYEESEARHRQLAAEEQEIRQQRETLDETLAQLMQEREDADRLWHAGTERQREAEQRVNALTTESAALESELKALRAVVQEELGYGAGGDVDEASIRGACRDITHALAEGITVAEGMERAIEAALGERVKAWMVETPEDACRAIGILKERTLGRACFVLRRRTVSETDRPSWALQLEQDAQVVGRAMSYVRSAEEFASQMSALLEQVYVVDSVNDGLDIMARYEWFGGYGPLLVTREGEAIDARGVVAGGVLGESGGILRRRGEIVRLEGTQSDVQLRIAEAREGCAHAEQEVARAQAQRDDLTRTTRDLEVRLVSLQKEESVREHARPDVARRLDTIRSERDAEEAERMRIDDEIAALQVERTELEAARADGADRLEEMQHCVEEHDEALGALSAEVTELRMADRTLQARLAHYEQQLVRLEQEGRQRDQRLHELDRQLEQLFRQTRESQDERVRFEDRFEKAEAKKREIDATLQTFQEQYQHALAQTNVREQQVARVRATLSEHLKVRGDIIARLTEVRTKIAAVEDTLTGTYDLSLDAVSGTIRSSVVADDAFQNDHADQEAHASIEAVDGSADNEVSDETPEVWQEHLQKIRDRLGRMGAINLAAIEEHQELEERCEFLTSQEKDLTASIESLQEIIERLNHTTSKLFTETFKQVQEKFHEVFTALFAGGHAELVLVEPDEGEEEKGRKDAGVDIVAQPPGKCLKNLSMLSGGEKTLTVMALLFASFLIKPSPFCVLDEVDAPLDEANVTRFGKFLAKMADVSQFVVITHNKRTMEIADSLFGVTMEEPGVSKLVSVRLHDLQAVL